MTTLLVEDAERQLSRAERGEVVGGGFIVLRRGKKNRLTGAFFPFEHGAADVAWAEAQKLAARHVGTPFEVYARIDNTAFVPKPEQVAS